MAIDAVTEQVLEAPQVTPTDVKPEISPEVEKEAQRYFLESVTNPKVQEAYVAYDQIDKEAAGSGLLAHVSDVTKMAILNGIQDGLPEEELKLLALAGHMHDVGKVMLKDDVQKIEFNGKPIDWKRFYQPNWGEFAGIFMPIMQQHSEKSFEALLSVDKLAAVVALQHHSDQPEGEGYPPEERIDELLKQHNVELTEEERAQTRKLARYIAVPDNLQAAAVRNNPDQGALTSEKIDAAMEFLEDKRPALAPFSTHARKTLEHHFSSASRITKLEPLLFMSKASKA